MGRKTVISILFLSSISLITGMPRVLTTFLGFVQVFLLSGHVMLLFLQDGRRGWFDDLVLSMLFSPILMVVSTLSLVRLAGSISRAYEISIYIFYVLLALAVLLRRVEDRSEENDGTGMISVFCISFAGLVGLAYLINPCLTWQGDAWYHASLISGLSVRGIPPTESLLAGFPLQYMWYYHLFVSAFVARTNVSIFQAMATFNVVVAFIFPYLMARYALHFVRERRRQVAVILLSLSGLASALWIFWPVELLRAFVGEVRFTDEIGRILGGVQLTDAKVIFTLAPYGTHMVNLLDKFLTITVFGYSLSLFMYSLLVLFRSNSKSGRVSSGNYVLMALAILGALMFHIVTGLTLVCSVAGFAALSFVLPRIMRRPGPEIRALIMLVVVLTLTLIVAVPFFRGMNLGSGGSDGGGVSSYLGFNFMNLFTIIVPLSLFSVYARRKVKHGEIDEMLELTCWILPVLALCLFIDLPSVNEGKFIFPLFLMIGAPIFTEILRWLKPERKSRNRAIITALLILFLPPPVLTYAGFMNNRPRVEPEIRRSRVDGEDKTLFSWIRNNTAPDAVFIENNSSHLIPVYTGRRNYFSDRGIIEVLGYDRSILSSYRQTVEDLFSTADLPRSTIEVLRNSDSDLFVLLWAEEDRDESLSGRFRGFPGLLKLVFVNDKAEVYRVVRKDGAN